uniref:non-specific serine/threonine protein kinase n=1 Tax=Strongyloides papillosus TaxID=174720 RepID=A0A0N5C626_STREA
MLKFNFNLPKLPHSIHLNESVYVLQELIGTGGFSNVFKGTKITATGSNTCAIKLGQEISQEQNVMNSVLAKNMLDEFFFNRFCPLPQVIDTGFDALTNQFFITMDVFPMSLDEYRNRCLPDGKFSLNDINDVVGNLLDALKYLSSFYVIHQDIKPANIMLKEMNNLKQVVLIDYGTAQMVDVSEKKDETTEEMLKKKVCMTPMYCAISIHEGSHKSFIDDLQAIFFNVYEWLTGELPWKHCKNNYNEIYRLKKEMYCLFSEDKKLNFSENNFLLLLVNTIRNLKTDDYPNYISLKQALNDIVFSKLNSTQSECSTASLAKKETGFYTLDVTQYMDVLSKMKRVSLADKLELKCVRSSMEISYLINKTKTIGVLIHFEKYSVRGFLFGYRLSFNTGIPGCQILDKFGHKRLNHRVTSLQSLLRGLLSLVRMYHRQAHDSITVIIIEPGFHTFLKDLQGGKITGKENTWGDSFKNDIEQYIKLVEKLNHLTIIYTEPKNDIQAVNETIQLVDSVITAYENESL